MGLGGVACPKPESRKRAKGRKDRARAQVTKDVRSYVFAREREICRCCRIRRAESMHELRPRSLRGKVSRRNSMAVCGDGVRGCHGFLQRHEITAHSKEQNGTEGTLVFVPISLQAADWLRVGILGKYRSIESPPMVEMETAE